MSRLYWWFIAWEIFGKLGIQFEIHGSQKRITFFLLGRRISWIIDILGGYDFEGSHFCSKPGLVLSIKWDELSRERAKSESILESIANKEWWPYPCQHGTYKNEWCHSTLKIRLAVSLLYFFHSLIQRWKIQLEISFTSFIMNKFWTPI